MKLIIKKGTTSKRVMVFIQDSALTTGAGKTGLTSASVTCYYCREDDGNVGGTAVSLVAATRGTWTSGGFVEKDGTNQPGFYELGLPDAALAPGAGWVNFHIKGAGIAMLPLEIQLDDVPIASNIKKNQALANFEFLMTDSTNHQPVTGKTVTCTRSIDGGGFTAGTLANVAEVANGIYRVDFGAGDLNGNAITLRCTATGCDDTLVTLVTTP